MYFRVSTTGGVAASHATDTRSREHTEPTLRARSALRAQTDASLGMHLCFARVDGAGTLPNYTKSSRTVWYIGHFTPAYTLNRDFLPRMQRFALHARPSGLTPDVLPNNIEFQVLCLACSCTLGHRLQLSISDMLLILGRVALCFASHAALRAARSAIGFNSRLCNRANQRFALLARTLRGDPDALGLDSSLYRIMMPRLNKNFLQHLPPLYSSLGHFPLLSLEPYDCLNRSKSKFNHHKFCASPLHAQLSGETQTHKDIGFRVPRAAKGEIPDALRALFLPRQPFKETHPIAMYLRVSITEDTEPTLRAYLRLGRRFALVKFQLLSTQRFALRAQTSTLCDRYAVALQRQMPLGPCQTIPSQSDSVACSIRFLVSDCVPRVQRSAIGSNSRPLRAARSAIGFNSRPLRAARSAIGFNSRCVAQNE
ncbi:hypothetical protein C8R47DRAFT_1082384 [Mycena vitilis]|nr:hypothetical protein C8R47DRAFT_1082384 [Mycena vitilis]